MKRKAVICDLDNTLTNSNHRVHWIAKSRNWDKFFSLAIHDTVNQWCLDLMKMLQGQGYEIIFVTGRPAFCQKDTMDWIKQHTPFEAIRGYNLFMRPNGDHRKDFIIKEEIYKNHLEPNYDIFLAVDDKPEVVKMWRRNGLVALYCGPLDGEEEGDKK